MAESNSPQHILTMSSEQRQRFLESFDWVFSDIDGVIYNLESDVPDAGLAYSALERAGKRLTFVTNNSVRTLEQTVRRFERSKIQVTPEQIWHPAQTLVYYLRSIQFEGLIYIMASQQFKAVLKQAGFQLLEGPNQFIEETYADLARHIFDKQPVRAVVIDVDFNLTSAKLMRAHLYLRHPDCLLITGATDRLLPVGKGVNIIGPGAFASILVEASGRPPIVMGKPGRPLGDMLLQQNKITDPRRVLMIGDMLAQDVLFGRQLGFQTLLVLTGGCSLSQLRAVTDPDLLPDYYADSVVDLVQLLAESTPKAHG